MTNSEDPDQTGYARSAYTILSETLVHVYKILGNKP